MSDKQLQEQVATHNQALEHTLKMGTALVDSVKALTNEQAIMKRRIDELIDSNNYLFLVTLVAIFLAIFI